MIKDDRNDVETTETRTDRRSRRRETAPAPVSDVTKVIVKVPNLNIRRGPGKDYDTVGKFAEKGENTITETVSGKGSTKGWGKLSNGSGWISLDYCE